MRSVKCAWAFCPGALRYQSFRSRARGASRYRHRLISSTMKLRPIDVKSLSPKEREELRKISKAIPLVADKEPLDVIFEDDNFLVVNKPDFVKMHPSHRFQGGSLLNRAIGHCGTIVPHILHRLDMHTTGVVMFAKKKELCYPISEQFSSGMVKKEYLLIADGCPTAGPGSQFAVEAPVQRHSTIKFARVLGCDRADSKPARTLYKVLDSSKHTGMSLMHIFPETGRTHQIRLHAAHVGFPIVGDSLYNPRERNMYKSIDVLNEAADDPSKVRFGDQNPLRGGLKLHAWRISLENPITKLPVTFCAPPASHFEALMKWANLKIPLEASIYCDVARDVARDDGC